MDEGYEILRWSTTPGGVSFFLCFSFCVFKAKSAFLFVPMSLVYGKINKISWTPLISVKMIDIAWIRLYHLTKVVIKNRVRKSIFFYLRFKCKFNSLLVFFFLEKEKKRLTKVSSYNLNDEVNRVPEISFAAFEVYREMPHPAFGVMSPLKWLKLKRLVTCQSRRSHLFSRFRCVILKFLPSGEILFPDRTTVFFFFFFFLSSQELT